MPAPDRTVSFLLLFLLAGLWGSSYLFIKIAVETITPLTLVAGRVTLSALVMLAYMKAIGTRLPTDARSWILLSGVGLTGNALAFIFLAWGVRDIDSGLAAILISTTPLFTAVIAHAFLAEERLSARNLTGIVVGFTGVVVLVWPDLFLGKGGSILGQVLVVLASLSYALSTVIAARVAHVEASAAATSSMIPAVFLVVPISLLWDRPWALAPSAASLWALLAVSLFGTAYAQIVFFQLVRRAGATFMSTVGYLIPLVGVLLGAVVLGEQPDAFALGALVLILTGVGIVQERRL